MESLYCGSVVNAEIVELRNISLLAELIVLCARSRKESRGLHFTLDYPKSREQGCDSVIRRGLEIEGERSWEREDADCG